MLTIPDNEHASYKSSEFPDSENKLPRPYYIGDSSPDKAEQGVEPVDGSILRNEH